MLEDNDHIRQIFNIAVLKNIIAVQNIFILTSLTLSSTVCHLIKMQMGQI